MTRSLINLPFLPVRAMRLVLEFVPCVVVTRVEAGVVQTHTVGSVLPSMGSVLPPIGGVIQSTAGAPREMQDQPIKSIKKKGDTIVGRVDSVEEDGWAKRKGGVGGRTYEFAIWMGERHGWVVAPKSGTDDRVLLNKISDDEFTVNFSYSHTLYTWDGSEFRETTLPHASTQWKPYCPWWYALTSLPDRNLCLDFFACGRDTFLINAVCGTDVFYNNTPASGSQLFAPALFNTRTHTTQPLRPKLPTTQVFEVAMLVMGCVRRSESQAMFMLCSNPHSGFATAPLCQIMTVDTQDPCGPSFSLVNAPLTIRRQRAAQTFLIHHLSDYHVYVGDSNGCLCLITYHAPEQLLKVHFQCSRSGMWTFDAHQIPVPDFEGEGGDIARIQVSHNRIHLFVSDGWGMVDRILYSDFRLDPLGHTPFARLKDPILDAAILEPSFLDVELRDGSEALRWVLDEIEAIKERRLKQWSC
jgi:hypothetical protein